MIRKWKEALLLLALVFWVKAVLNFNNSSVFAQSNEEKLQELNRQIQEYQSQIAKLQGQANTLSNQIAQFDAQIRLTELKISQTEEKIILLSGRIEQLKLSLNSLSSAFSSRVVETYKMTRLEDHAFILTSTKDLVKAVSRFHYLKIIQEADHSLIKRLLQAQNTYEDQKLNLEDLKTELDKQKKSLDIQKAAKAQLLTLTRNDEKRYQTLLAQARAELEAIQAIIAGRGEETEVGRVNEGDRIASIIPTASACSNGAHLHFEVVKDRVHQNPASFLIPKDVIWDNAPDSPFSFSGSWQWPINDPVRITQGYGMTYYANNLKYYGGNPHTGLDMVNDNKDYTVKAVKNGVLYRGAIGCGGGTLRYVRVRQDDGYDTYYLHISY